MLQKFLGEYLAENRDFLKLVRNVILLSVVVGVCLILAYRLGIFDGNTENFIIGWISKKLDKMMSVSRAMQAFVVASGALFVAHKLNLPSVYQKYRLILGGILLTPAAPAIVYSVAMLDIPFVQYLLFMPVLAIELIILSFAVYHLPPKKIE